MASITQRRFATGFKKALVLANEEWCRMLPYGNTWSRLRIGIQCGWPVRDMVRPWNDTPLFIGICSGLEGGWRYRVKNYLGWSLTGSQSFLGGRVMTHAEANDAAYSYNSTGPYGFHRIFDYYTGFPVDPSSAAHGATFYYVPYDSAAINRRQTYIIDVSRKPGGSGEITSRLYSYSSSQYMYDMTPDEMFEQVWLRTTPSMNNLAFTYADATFYASECTGPLDTLSIFWGATVPPLEVYAVAVCPMYDTASQFLGQVPIEFKPSGAHDPVEMISGVGTFFGTAQVTGTNWPDPIIINTGWSGSYPQALTPVGYGTYANNPYDTFETYASGTVVSGTTVNGGSNWTGAAYIYT
jgi:hypothetical protein